MHAVDINSHWLDEVVRKHMQSPATAPQPFPTDRTEYPILTQHLPDSGRQFAKVEMTTQQVNLPSSLNMQPSKSSSSSSFLITDLLGTSTNPLVSSRSSSSCGTPTSATDPTVTTFATLSPNCFHVGLGTPAMISDDQQATMLNLVTLLKFYMAQYGNIMNSRGAEKGSNDSPVKNKRKAVVHEPTPDQVPDTRCFKLTNSQLHRSNTDMNSTRASTTPRKKHRRNLDTERDGSLLQDQTRRITNDSESPGSPQSALDSGSSVEWTTGKETSDAGQARIGQCSPANSALDALIHMATSSIRHLRHSPESTTCSTSQLDGVDYFRSTSAVSKKRKTRTTFSNSQLAELEKNFNRQKYLTPTDRDRIAGQLGLTNTQVITWFQNRRAKLKRETEELERDIMATRQQDSHHSRPLTSSPMDESQKESTTLSLDTMCNIMNNTCDTRIRDGLTERKSSEGQAPDLKWDSSSNKATTAPEYFQRPFEMLVNRSGRFGMPMGMMPLWSPALDLEKR